MSNNDIPEIPIETIAETENYTIWTADEPDDEKTYHVELGPVTVHFFQEEWEEFLEMVREAAEESGDSDDDDDDEGGAEIELDWGSLWFDDDEWTEFRRLIGQV